MEKLDNSIYGKESLFKIVDQLKEWNHEKLNGIGFYRKHDKYSFIELSIYDLNNYPEKNQLEDYYSYLDWKVDQNQFPTSYYESGEKELVKYAEFITDWFSSIKGENLRLLFEINFAGYHPADFWGRGAAGRAFLNAIISCFDDELYKMGVEKKAKNHPLKNGINQSVYHPG